MTPATRTAVRPVLIGAAIGLVLLIGGGLLLVGTQWAPGGAVAGEGPPRAAAVAERAGCTGFAIEATEEMFVREAGRCAIGGQAVRVKVFADGEQRDNYLRVAKAYGGAYVVGDRYLLAVENADLAEQLADRLGASVA